MPAGKITAKPVSQLDRLYARDPSFCLQTFCEELENPADGEKLCDNALTNACIAMLQSEIPGVAAKGRELIAELAARGCHSAMLDYATCLIRGDGGRRNRKKAVQVLEDLVSKPNLDRFIDRQATQKLAEIYREGWGVPTDFKKAVQLFLRAAELGSESACLNAGNIYNGSYRNEAGALVRLETGPDLEMSAICYHQANHDHRCATNLALLHVYGEIKNADHGYGVSLLRKSAAEGDEIAMRVLCDIGEDGYA